MSWRGEKIGALNNRMSAKKKQQRVRTQGCGGGWFFVDCAGVGLTQSPFNGCISSLSAEPRGRRTQTSTSPKFRSEDGRHSFASFGAELPKSVHPRKNIAHRTMSEMPSVTSFSCRPLSLAYAAPPASLGTFTRSAGMIPPELGGGAFRTRCSLIFWAWAPSFLAKRSLVADLILLLLHGGEWDCPISKMKKTIHHRSALRCSWCGSSTCSRAAPIASCHVATGEWCTVMYLLDSFPALP